MEFLKYWLMSIAVLFIILEVVKLIRRKKRVIPLRIVYQVIWVRTELHHPNVAKHIWDVIIRSYTGFSQEEAIGKFLVDTESIQAIQKLTPCTFVIDVKY